MVGLEVGSRAGVLEIAESRLGGMFPDGVNGARR